MRPGGSKGKGAGFERKVCGKLSRMIQSETDETLFWRSAMSGGRATIQRRSGIQNKTQLGDITCVHADGQWVTANFFIECKFLKNLDIQSALLDGRGKLYAFWKIARREAKSHDRKPLLIARENRSRTLLIIGKAGRPSWEAWRPIDVQPLLYSQHLSAYIYDFESFLSLKDS
jgi:hypothetical protein